jgi:rubrerythrin
MFEINDIIDLAIQIERNAEKVYRSAQKKISNPNLSILLEWLADEEVEHAKWFSRLKKTINTPINDPAMEEMGKALLSEVLGSQSFSLEDADFCEISQLTELLSLAIEFEKDKVTFYRLLLPFIKDQATLDFLESIIKEENNHIQRLQKFLDTEAPAKAIMSESA